jgi:hypothetical protein
MKDQGPIFARKAAEDPRPHDRLVLGSLGGRRRLAWINRLMVAFCHGGLTLGLKNI